MFVLFFRLPKIPKLAIKGRKNIQPILEESAMKKDTLKAKEEEAKRIERLEQKKLEVSSQDNDVV